MNYGDILTDSFKILWKEKKLWIIGALGTALFAIGNMFYTGGYLNWYQSMMRRMMSGPEFPDPETMASEIGTMLYGYVAIMALWGVFSLIGYVVNLAARGGGIAEAGRAWQGEPVDISRGLAAGVRKSPGLFVLDLIWALPGLLFTLIGGGIGLALLFGFFSSLGQFDDAAASGRVLGLFGGFFAVLMLFFCLGFLYMLVRAVFSPLMYQSLVLGEKSLGEAIKEGWRLSRAHLGAMVVFWLLLLAVNMGLGVVMELVAMPFSFLLIFPMFGAMQNPDALLSSFHWPLFILFSLAMGAVVWLVRSLMQSLRLSLYARVYRELTRPEGEASETTLSQTV